MTTSELIRLLKKNGCIAVDNDKKHFVYRSPITGKEFLVGRHAKEEVRTGTLHKILKMAGIFLKR